MNKVGMRAARVVGIIAVALLAAGCPGDDPPAEDRPMDMPMEDMHDMPMGHMEMDPEMMRRHADEAESMAAEMREHVDEMRGLSPARQHERMGEHVAAVSGMLSLMNRQMREMSMGMHMDDEQMGAMMGMSGAEHRHMMGELGALRADLEALQVASAGEVAERMPQHLDRVEAMVRMLGHSAEHMRRM